MTITINYKKTADAWKDSIGTIRPEWWIAIIALSLAVGATYYSFVNDIIIAYGDAESHLNISKRVVDSLTPGFAQLGGIWLPLPHLLMAPFVYFDTLWRTGLAGSIVSGASFIVAAIYIYKLSYLITKHVWASFFAAIIFMINPNILYLQSTPMTEMLLIVFFVLSTYFFVKYLHDTEDIYALLLAAFFGFMATLSRYDGWFLVIIEALILGLMYLPRPFMKEDLTFKNLKVFISQNLKFRKDPEHRKHWNKLIGKIVLFTTLAFFGILLWLGWDALILGDPLFFTHSEFSAKSQQQGWDAKGQLPASGSIILSFLYYFVTSLSNVGLLLFIVGIIGFLYYLAKDGWKYAHFLALLLMTPFIFYVVTLYMGQSIIFIPHLTPDTFEWTLFNVRYGVMMVPAASIFIGYLLSKSRGAGKYIIALSLIMQMALFGVGFSTVVSLDDAVVGLSSGEKSIDPQVWLTENYDDGLVLLDDFKRLMSIIKVGVDMDKVIYIGNKPYWEESIQNPEKYATWVIVQKDDEIWNKVYTPEAAQGHLYAHFTKVYTSPEILIFKRTIDIDVVKRDN